MVAFCDQAEHHVGVLTGFYLGFRLRALAHDGVDGQIVIHAVFHADA